MVDENRSWRRSFVKDLGNTQRSGFVGASDGTCLDMTHKSRKTLRWCQDKLTMGVKSVNSVEIFTHRQCP